MPYTLRSTGVAAALVSCVGVDDDGTIKDFVAGNTISLDTGVAASVAAGAWKGISSPKYFVTTANGSFDFNGVRWTGTKPNASTASGDTDGLGTFMALHGASNCTAFCNVFTEIATGPGNNSGPGRVSTADAHGLFKIGGTAATTATNLPTDGTTKFSFATNYIYNTSSEVFYGLESGSLASDGTAGPDGGFGGATLCQAIGGSAGQGNHPHSVYINCVFSRTLTLAEYQSLHDDWFTVLFGATPPTLFRGDRMKLLAAWAKRQRSWFGETNIKAWF